MKPFSSLLRPPDNVTLFNERGHTALHQEGGVRPGRWTAAGIEVTTHPEAAQMPITVRAGSTPLARLRLRWNFAIESGYRLLGDHWERGYGDLEWRGIAPNRIMPWYVLWSNAGRTGGFGVKTGASSLASWQVDSGGVTLWLDLRCGGSDCVPGDRTIPAATVVELHAPNGQSAFHSAQAFCRIMSPTPRLPDHPVYGGNNWYYAYGNSSHKQIVQDSINISALASNQNNRPYMVIDMGWSIHSDAGSWRTGSAEFPDMPGLAREMRQAGVRPGIWVRPTYTRERLPETAYLASPWSAPGSPARMLDPTVPEAARVMREDIRTLVSWGYDLIKHDFSTYDLTGRWGFEMGATVTSSGWSFADKSRTTAEVIGGLYRLLREAAGKSILIGCNTIGHLAAGLFELQRTGDDTSGREWERTRRMGVNTLAFRMPQHGAFFAVDADCVGLTREVPWELNRQWLDLLARSGTPLFVSAAPDALGEEQKSALRAAFEVAASGQPVAEPLDWQDTVCPQQWNLHGARTTYHWDSPEGVPFADLKL